MWTLHYSARWMYYIYLFLPARIHLNPLISKHIIYKQYVGGAKRYVYMTTVCQLISTGWRGCLSNQGGVVEESLDVVVL